MKCHILHDFRTSDPFMEKSSHDLKNLPKTEAVDKLDVNLTS